MNTEEVKGIMYGKVTDFAEKVAPIYKLLDWRWGGNAPPDQAEIEHTLTYLIDHFKEGSCATGGLTVFFDKEDSEIGIRFEYNDSIFF